jgi:hypothetical protein
VGGARAVSPALTLGQLAPALDAAQRVGTASSAVLLAGAVIALGGAVVWCVREISRLQEARLADHKAHAATLATVQGERIEEIERIVRGCDTLADALRAVEALRDSYAPRAPRAR